MTIGFNFRGKHSSDFNIGVRSEDRSLIPARRQVTYEIPGRDGNFRYSDGEYDVRDISLRLCLNSDNWEHLRIKAREIANWLSGSGRLIFDDEPDKVYNATLKKYVGLEQIELLSIGECVITFECQPFAEDIHYNQFYVESSQNDSFFISSSGLENTPCIIKIKNTGNTDLTNIKIIRKAGVE